MLLVNLKRLGLGSEGVCRFLFKDILQMGKQGQFDKLRTYRRLGGAQLGNRFVSFVRACVRMVWLPSGIGSKVLWAGLFPFPFLLG